MEKYIEQINKYLPIRFTDDESNEFVNYLSSAYIENVEKEKYQFAYIAFHMLNMIYYYKTKWFLKERGNQNILNLLNRHSSLTFNGIFDLSLLNEKESLEKLLEALQFHANDIGICKNHVDVRNNCSHASGRIYYKTPVSIGAHIETEINYIERIQKKLKNDLKTFMQEFLETKWNNPFLSSDFHILLEEQFFSYKDLEYVSQIQLPIFKKSSSKEENFKQKILYLLFINEIQKELGLEKNIFLEKLPIMMVGISEKIKVEKDGDIVDVYSSELIEENLMPIISTFPNQEREKAEEIFSNSNSS